MNTITATKLNIVINEDEKCKGFMEDIDDYSNSYLLIQQVRQAGEILYWLVNCENKECIKCSGKQDGVKIVGRIERI